ncbi:MAG: AraC family transcriptional regulator [Acidobacteriota bacterium]
MRVSERDWFLKDKTMYPGEGHGLGSHDYAVLTLVLHGRLDECFSEGVQSCDSWQLHFKPRAVVHETAVGLEGVRMLIFGVRDDWLEERLPRSARSRAVAASSARAFGALLALRDAEGMKLTRELAVEIFDHFDHQEGGETAGPAWIGEVEDLLRQEDEKAPSLTDLGRRFRLHPGSLVRAFRRARGCSIGEWRSRHRVARAIDLLSRDEASVATVAHRLGFADQSHLTREFKRRTGWTPASFRRTASSFGRLNRS